MSSIGPWVHSNALSAKAFAIESGFDDIGDATAASVSQSGYFIDIDR